jgi:hypothetical protein
LEIRRTHTGCTSTSFRTFGTSIISINLSESRKRGLFLTLAHQFISQLDLEIQETVLDNCSTIISFRVGANDAPAIAKATGWAQTFEHYRDQDYDENPANALAKMLIYLIENGLIKTGV